MVLWAYLNLANAEDIVVEQVLPIEPTEQLKLFGRGSQPYLIKPALPEPLYILSTPTFNHCLADAEKLELCRTDLIDKVKVMSDIQEGLERCSEQLYIEEQGDKEAKAQMAALQSQLAKRTGERNFLVGVSVALAISMLASAVVTVL